MASELSYSSSDSFVVEGKLALPYKYFAGRTGSKFLIALRDEKKILGVRCPKCEKVYVPPRLTCERHVDTKLTDWVELSSSGVITSFTVVRYAEPHQPLKPPYIIGLIKLDGAGEAASGPALAHIVKGIDPGEMRVGLRVRAVFAKTTTSTILDIDHFAPETKAP